VELQQIGVYFEAHEKTDFLLTLYRMVKKLFFPQKTVWEVEFMSLQDLAGNEY